MSPSRVLEKKKFKELKDLADKSLATQILDHKAYGLKILHYHKELECRKLESLCKL